MSDSYSTEHSQVRDSESISGMANNVSDAFDSLLSKVAESGVGNGMPQEDLLKNKQQQFKQWAKDSGAHYLCDPVTSNERQQLVLAELKIFQTLLGHLADLYIQGPNANSQELAGIFISQIDDRLNAIHREVGLPTPAEAESIAVDELARAWHR
ncbi:hypothetical protein FDECE_18000 [Fusarium decemcellulare]|nr:hypothetical protein FDECE_18000 [Fusarium decemcellulare]